MKGDIVKMKKISILFLCLLLLVGCSNIKKPELSFTEGRVLEKGESKGMLGVEGTITELGDDTILVDVAGTIYKFEMTDKFEDQLESFRDKGHKIRKGTYVQIFYTEEKGKTSQEYKDVYEKINVAHSFSIVYAN